MEKVELSDLFVKALEPRAELYEVADSKRDGLWLRVHPTGRVSFCFRFRFRGRWLRKSYRGRYPEVSLKTARGWALEDAAKLLKGEDPRGDEKEVRKLTVALLADDFLAEEVPQKAESTQREYRRILASSIVPELGNVPVAELRPRDVVRFLDQVAKRGGVMANRTRAVLSALYAFGRRRGLDLVNPVSGTLARPEGKGERYLEDDEIAAFWAAMLKRERVTGLALLFALVTGQRSREVRHLRWADLKALEGRQEVPAGLWWELPSWLSKNRRAHVVPLLSLAQSILRLQKPQASEIVFAGSDGGVLGETALGQATRKYCKRHGMTGERSFSPHDLRRTVATQMSRLGVDQFVIDRCLNHSMGGIRGRYNQWNFLQQRHAAYTTWDEHLVALLKAEGL